MGNPLPPPTVLTALAIGPNLESSVRVIPPSDSPIPGTAYQLVLDDDGLWKRTTNSGAVTVTVPPHSAVPIPVNSSILISQGGSGAVTVAAGAGVTLNASGGTLATTSEFEVIRLFQNTLDNWTLTITGTGSSGGGNVPTGGTTNQVLAKASNTNFDTAWVDQSGGGGALSVTVALTANQLNHLFSAPVSVVAAPGVGKVAVPLSVTLVYSHGSHGYYTESSADHPQMALGATYLYQGALILELDTLTSSVSGSPFSGLRDGGGLLDLATLANQPLKFGNSVADLIDFGEVASSTLLAGGLLYNIGDTGGFNENHTAGTYTVTGVGAGGAVTSYTLGTGDEVVNGCTAGQTLTTFVNTGGGDGNFSITVDTIAPGNGTASVTVQYAVLDVP